MPRNWRTLAFFVFGLAEMTGIDLQAAVESKLAVNRACSYRQVGDVHEAMTLQVLWYRMPWTLELALGGWRSRACAKRLQTLQRP